MIISRHVAITAIVAAIAIMVSVGMASAQEVEKKAFIVFFDHDETTIRPDAADILTEAANYVKQGGTVAVQLTGHADTSGSSAYNQGLSERRAAAVKDFLVGQGVPADKITTLGKGETDLLVATLDNTREPRNRRVETEVERTIATTPEPERVVSQPPPPPPPPEPKYDWSGVYFGAHGGLGWTQADVTNVSGSHFYNSVGESDNYDVNGGLFGGQVGIQFQGGGFVFGVEYGVAANDIDDTITRQGPFSPNRLNTEFDGGIHQAVVRLGIALGEQGDSLAYVRGGWAGASMGTFATEGTFFPGHDGFSDEFHNGWVAGIGYEIAINRMLSFGIEYNYMDLDEERHTGRDAINFSPYVVDVDPEGVHTVLLKLNMNLGWIF